MALSFPETEDPDLLRVVRELSARFDVLNVAVEKVTWRTSVRADECYFRQGSLFISDRMRGQLQPEEWTPLVASAMLAHQIDFTRRIRVSILTWVVIIVLELVIPYLLNLQGMFPVLSIVGLALFTIYFGLFMIPKSEVRKRLSIDRKVARTLSVSPFLRALQKARSIERIDLGSSIREETLPSIEQRIRNLEHLHAKF